MLNEDGVAYIVNSLSGSLSKLQQGWYREASRPFI